MTETIPVPKLFDLTDCIAIVTGAPGQLGETMAETLAEQGAHVVVVSRTRSDCETLARRLSSKYQRALAVPADVTERDEVKALIERVKEEFGRLDVLINNAYSGDTIPFEEMTVAEFEEGIRSGLTSAFLMIQESLDLLCESGGSVINVASIYGIVAPDHSIYGETGMNNPVHYGAAKAGLLQLSRWIATRFAKENLRSNALTPGGIYNPELELCHKYEKAFVQNYEDRTPLGRMGRPDDVKGAVAFLASDASSWVTGQNLIVDGGWTAW